MTLFLPADSRASLPPPFYNRDAAVVARELLGAELRFKSAHGVLSGVIVETEAYLGPHDPACHATAGRTARTWHLFGSPGTAYVYFVYGMHWCVNAVTREEGFGSAVLIRAVQPRQGIELMRVRRPKARRDADLCNGPAKLCAAFGITRAQDGVSLVNSALQILHGESVPDDQVIIGPRVGISKAVDWPLRFRIGEARGATATAKATATATATAGARRRVAPPGQGHENCNG